MRQVILSIDDSKLTPVGDILAGILNVTLDKHLPLLTKIVNSSFENGSFPDDLNLGSIMYSQSDHSSQRCLTFMFQIWKHMLDKEGYACAMLWTLCDLSDYANDSTLHNTLEYFAFRL